MTDATHPAADDVVAYAAVPEIKPIPDAPYRGVKPFRFIDQQIFVGRESETWNLISSIMIYRGVLLYGSSGSGKSSMINAGLIPKAREENFIPNLLRVQPWAGREIKVERIPIEQDEKPPYLPSTFTSDDSQPSFECSIEQIHRTLKNISRRTPPEGGIDYTKPPEPRPMLIFDQFEEFITLFEEAASNDGSAAQNGSAKTQRAILDAVTDLIHDESLPIKILFVFREDYLGKLSILFENSPDLLDQYVRLLPPRVDKLQEIIRAPFENPELSAVFLQGQRKSKAVELLKLSDRIAADLRQHSRGSVNLSELQIVCRKLWDSDNPSALMKRDKSVQTLIEEYWADALNQFPDELQDPAVALLGHMITSSNTRNIVSEDNLITDEKQHFEPELLKRALEALVKSSLVRREPRNNLYFYEIVSEYLVPWIQRLRDAQKAEFDRLRVQQNLDVAESQNRVLRKWRWGLASLSILLVIFIAVTGVLAYSHLKSKAANEATKDREVREREAKIAAERQVVDASKVLMKFQDLTSASGETRLAAIREIESINRESPISPEAAKLLSRLVIADPDPRVAQAAKELVSKLVQSNPQLEAHAVIYLESQDNIDQKARANRIRTWLTRYGVSVEGDKYGKGPSGNTVKPCAISQDTVQPGDIVQMLKDVDQNEWTITPTPNCGPSDKVVPNYYEIRFASEKGDVLDTLRGIERQWKAAKVTANVSVLQRVFADDFVNIDPDGKISTKAEWIEMLRGSPMTQSEAVIGQTKLLSYSGNIATLQLFLPNVREVDIDVFVKRQGRWQVLSSQSTKTDLNLYR
jgi:hypothetical protein